MLTATQVPEEISVDRRTERRASLDELCQWLQGARLDICFEDGAVWSLLTNDRSISQLESHPVRCIDVNQVREAEGKNLGSIPSLSIRFA